MQRIIPIIITICLLSLQACLPPPPDPEPEPWNKVEDFSTLTTVLNMYVSPLELYIVTNDEFLRLDVENKLVERRRIDIPNRLFGRPAISESTFFRLIRNNDGVQELNFYLTKNADPIYKIEVNDLLGANDNGLLASSSGVHTGAYNNAGTQFMLPFIRLPEYSYSFFLFDITLNEAKTEFVSIEVNKRIDAPDLPGDADNLGNLRYINGFYYATSLDGSVRLNPETGESIKIFDEWLFDFFAYDGKIYGTSFGSVLYVSSDNGISWTLVEQADPITLEFVEVANNKVFTQRGRGAPYGMATSDLSKANDLKQNESFSQEFAAFQSIKHFYGRYYLSVLDELYYSCNLKIVEE